jgi:hypothetical protein
LFKPIKFIPAKQNVATIPMPPIETTQDPRYYCYSSMQIQDKKCCVECKLLVRKTADSDSWDLL